MNNELHHTFLDPNIPRKSGELTNHIEGVTKSSSVPPMFSLVEFNLSGLCNRKCVFCPRSNPDVYPNVNQHIPIELYEKIMKELGVAQYDGMILYSAFGEPLLYKNIEVVIQMSKQYCPKVKLESVTDGDFVTVDKIRSLFNAGLDTLLISMYDGPHQEEQFKAMIQESEIGMDKVVLRRRWLPPEEHFGITLSNRAGMVNMPEVGIGALSEPLKRPCYYPYYQILIDYDGSVLLCPHDWGKKLIAGNVNRESLLDIWNNMTMRRVRKSLALADRNFAPCDACDVDGTLMGKAHFDRWESYYSG